MGKPGESAGLRARLFRAVHAEGLKRGLDHDGLRDVCRERFKLESMGKLQVNQLQQLYRGFTGYGFRARKAGTRPAAPLPKRGYGQRGELEMVSADHLETLARAFAMRGWGRETQRVFIRRQLSGREQIRTTRDFQRVFRGVQAMNRRDGLAGA